MTTARITDGVAAQLRVRKLEAFIRKLEASIRRIHEREWPAGDKDKAAKHAAEMWAIADEARHQGEF